MKRLAAVVGVLALMSACATNRGGYYQDDGPHSRPKDVSAVPDAVPRDEPLSARGNRAYKVFGVSYRPLTSATGYRERGIASWYGKKFHGRLTSSGEPYDMYAMTAAHKTLPLPSYARIRNLNNGRTVIVRINDRGPFLHNRLVDLSYAAAYRLGIVGTGTGIVEVEGLTGHETPPARIARQPELMASAHAAERPRLYLQVGAFSARNNAERLRDRMIKNGLQPVQIQEGQSGGSSIFRVRLGPIGDVDASDRLAARVREQGIANPVIVVDP